MRGPWMKPLPTGAAPDCDPPGWNPNAYTKGSKILIARAHLLAKTLGGPGTCNNLVTACQTVNQAMYNQAEQTIKNLVGMGMQVDYRVTATYDTLQDAIPSSILVEAIWMKQDGTCGTLSTPFPNPTNLQQCM